MAPLTGVTPIFALSFAGNAAGCNMVRKITGHEKLSYGELFCGGMLAGVYSTIIMAPGERIKCLLQVAKPGQYKGMGDCAKERFLNFDQCIYKMMDKRINCNLKTSKSN